MATILFRPLTFLCQKPFPPFLSAADSELFETVHCALDLKKRLVVPFPPPAFRFVYFAYFVVNLHLSAPIFLTQPPAALRFDVWLFFWILILDTVLFICGNLKYQYSFRRACSQNASYE